MNAIALVLLSSLASKEEVAAWSLAVRGQLRNHVSPTWNLRAPVLTLYESLLDVPNELPLICLFDDSDHAGALGYHTETPDGRIYARVFIRDSIIEGSAPSTVLSHEAIEMLLNPDVNAWKESGRGDDLWAMEGCDAVQADSYVYRGVRVSNFVTPAFFDPRPPAGARFDWMGRLSDPFTLSPGGYTVLRRGGELQQVYAAGGPSVLAATTPELPSKLAPASRTQRLLRSDGVAAV